MLTGCTVNEGVMVCVGLGRRASTRVVVAGAAVDMGALTGTEDEWVEEEEVYDEE